MARGSTPAVTARHTLRWWTIGLVLWGPLAVQAGDPLAQLLVLALAPLEGQAVLQGPRGSIFLARLGDRLQGTSTTLVQVLADRLVLEEPAPGQASGTRLVWLYQAPRDGGPSRLLRLWSDVPASEPAGLPTAPVLPGPP